MIRKLLRQGRKNISQQVTEKWTRMLLNLAFNGHIQITMGPKYMKQMLSKLSEKNKMNG